jgi:hypothetical protein
MMAFLKNKFDLLSVIIVLLHLGLAYNTHLSVDRHGYLHILFLAITTLLVCILLTKALYVKDYRSKVLWYLVLIIFIATLVSLLF